jgi:CRP-like cAMP-binding protein
MSLISGEPLGASLQAVEPLTVLYRTGQYFRDLLVKTPAIQIFLTRLLARRIADANLIRSEETVHSLQGNVVDILPRELLQTHASFRMIPAGRDSPNWSC